MPSFEYPRVCGPSADAHAGGSAPSSDRRALPAFWAVLLAFLPTCAKRDAPPSSGVLARSSAGISDPATAGSAEQSARREGPQSARAKQELAVAQAERREEREHLVRSLATQGISDSRVLAALQRVPRHRFVPEAFRREAYADRPLPIGWGQTISQPTIVGMMTQAVAPEPSDRCLEIGTGSGYQAAILAELCGSTASIEYLPEVAQFGRANLEALGYSVELRVGDGYRGWPERAPFDVILVTAAPTKVPEPLLAQLAIGGRLAIPVGPEARAQQLELWKRVGPGSEPSAFERHSLADVRFVPFLGNGGN